MNEYKTEARLLGPACALSESSGVEFSYQPCGVLSSNLNPTSSIRTVIRKITIFTQTKKGEG